MYQRIFSKSFFVVGLSISRAKYLQQSAVHFLQVILIRAPRAIYHVRDKPLCNAKE
jgi:hypothetical protein